MVLMDKSTSKNCGEIEMSLKIYYGSQIEDLAGKLVEELRTERKEPFEFLKVAVAGVDKGNCV